MQFAYWDASMADGDGVVAVDGSLPVPLELCHEVGTETPDRFRADLAVEMAFAVVDDPIYDDLRVATTQTYGTDALLATWVLTEPDKARPHRDLLVDAAASGDYHEPVGDDAVQLDLLVDGYRYGDESPLSFKLDDWSRPVADATVFEVILETLPNLLDQVDDYQYVWWDAWERVRDDDQAFEDGVFEVDVADGVALIEGPRFPAPRAVTRHVDADVYVYAADAGGGTAYRVDACYHAWAATVDRPRVDVPDLGDVADGLNGDEPAGTGRWMQGGYAGRGKSEILRFAEADGSTPPSGLAPDDVADRVRSAR